MSDSNICNGGKPNLVLDLDNTLISSLTFPELSRMKAQPQLLYVDMPNYFRIFFRPYLHDFLDYVFKNFNVTIWSAGTRDYVLYIVEHILLKPNMFNDYTKTNPTFKNFKMILHSGNCEQSTKYYHEDSPKDLRYLYNFQDYYACNTFILDDLDHVSHANPKQTIVAIYFDAKKQNAHKDTFLMDVVSTLDRLKYHSH